MNRPAVPEPYPALTTPCADPVVEAVRDDLRRRSALGQAKYGGNAGSRRPGAAGLAATRLRGGAGSMPVPAAGAAGIGPAGG